MALAMAGALLGACSSGSSSPSTSVPTTPGVSTTTVRTAPSTTSTSSSSPSTTAAGLPRCATPALTGAIAGSSGAAGTIETTVSLTSTSATPCALGGYPGLGLLSANGSALQTNVVRKGNYTFTDMAPTTVTLSKGQAADFNIGYSDVPVGNETTCPSSAFLVVTPPNAYDHLVIGATMAPCGGGTMVVSPVFAASGAGSQSTAPGG
ncbi:MAG: DUF4232 domain-containing protein [Acidimicrobiales bacterium]